MGENGAAYHDLCDSYGVRKILGEGHVSCLDAAFELPVECQYQVGRIFRNLIQLLQIFDMVKTGSHDRSGGRSCSPERIGGSSRHCSPGTRSLFNKGRIDPVQNDVDGIEARASERLLALRGDSEVLIFRGGNKTVA